MAKFFKEVGNSISATLQATTAITQSVAHVATTIADGASQTVEPLVGVISDSAELARVYTIELLADARADSTVNQAISANIRDHKAKAFKAILADTETQAKLQASALIAIMEELEG